MYQLYIANKNYSSWSLRPWLLMKVLNIPFEEKLQFFEDDNWDVFREFSPNGKVPCLVAEQLPVWDSLAITEFLAEKFPHVWAGDPLARAWSRCAAAEMHSGFSSLRSICSMNCSIQVQLASIPESLQKDIDRIDELFQQGLQQFGGPFLAGPKFTAVDAFFAPVAFRVACYGLMLSATAMSYVQTLLKLEAMQQWAIAGQQELPHAAHEQACLQHGLLSSDVRIK